MTPQDLIKDPIYRLSAFSSERILISAMSRLRILLAFYDVLDKEKIKKEINIAQEELEQYAKAIKDDQNESKNH